MNDGLIFLDEFVNVIAVNERANGFLEAQDGVMTCGEKLRFEDKLAFSTLLSEIYSNNQSVGAQKEWYASRPSQCAPYKLKLFILNDFNLKLFTKGISSLLIISESND